jgi:8-oxo-dGTP pyrophosphatase MutT (NUDIX family)
MFDAFAKKLANAFGHPLPGKVGQQQLKPYLKISRQMDAPQLLKPKTAAVMSLLFPVAGIPHMLFIERPMYDGVHSGQIAFPGGRVERNDSTTLDAALRETEEEIGIPKTAIRVAGALTEVYVLASNFMVHPFAGIVEALPELVLDEKEVASVLQVPLYAFFEKDVLKEKPIKNSLGFTLMAPYYDLNGKVLWGATAMMVSELCAVIRNHGIPYR